MRSGLIGLALRGRDCIRSRRTSAESDNFGRLQRAAQTTSRVVALMPDVALGQALGRRPSQMTSQKVEVGSSLPPLEGWRRIAEWAEWLSAPSRAEDHGGEIRMS